MCLLSPDLGLPFSPRSITLSLLRLSHSLVDGMVTVPCFRKEGVYAREGFRAQAASLQEFNYLLLGMLTR